MNIFVVEEDPILSAQALCDKHVVKMVLESAQILSTVSHKLGKPGPYRPTHKNHPCVLWAGATFENWKWLYYHLFALSREYTFRYGKVHKTAEHLVTLREIGRPEKGELTPFVQAMPDELRGDNAVDAYRRYYVRDKARFARWTRREKPVWFPETAQDDN